MPGPTEEYAAARDRSKAAAGHETDARLRSFGFRIVSRPRDGEALWERGGRLYTQREAVVWVAHEIRKVERNTR